MLLLSGGEKAFTALSLLMAIFQYAPSSFWILDEVDAPQDEPNIQRLMGLLRDMSSHTELIVITRAKRTMWRAGAVWVAIQQAGMSKLISVRLNAARAVIAAAAGAASKV